MKKCKLIVTILFLLNLWVPHAFGASDRCVVKESRGTTVILECNKKSGNFKVDDKVKVKTARTKKVKK